MIADSQSLDVSYDYDPDDPYNTLRASVSLRVVRVYETPHD